MKKEVNDMIVIAVLLSALVAFSHMAMNHLDRIATAIENQQTENVSYITTPHVTINDVKWDVAEEAE